MISGVRIASVAAASALALSVSPVSAVAAEPCVSGAQVSAMVHDFVGSLRDDVTSRPARSAVAQALVQTLHTYRGADADTAAERRALGEQIAATARQRRDAGSRVERQALTLEIKALVEQRERGAFTAAEREDIRAAVAALKSAVVDKTDRRVEGQAVAEFFRELHTQLNCHG